MICSRLLPGNFVFLEATPGKHNLLETVARRKVISVREGGGEC